MLLLITSKASKATLDKSAQDLDGYIKFVVDIDKKIMTAGGLRHFEGEQLLLLNGSRQKDLWGGGVDLQTKELDYESMINIRPAQNNSSRELLDLKIRDQVKQIVSDLLVKI